MSPWARALRVECKASNCPKTATANRLGMLPVPDMYDHIKGPLGLKRHHVKNCGPGPALCLRREWRLRHSPTVVAGSSRDRKLYRDLTKGRAARPVRNAPKRRALWPSPSAPRWESGAFMYVSVNSARKTMSTCTRNEAEKIGELQRHVTVKSDPVLQRTEELVDNGVVRGKEKRTISPFLEKPPTLRGIGAA